MGFPFPDDGLAMSRLDWCRAGSAKDYDGLSCVLRAKMCAAHINATKNKVWGSLANPVFQRLLEAPKIEQWTSCPEVVANGTCGLLLTDRYQKPLWETLGSAREREAYASIVDGQAPGPASDRARSARLPNCT
jgi:hypothetical protein